ncbi:hypothetical protein FCV25MIE_07798 [Fagus crenata]
MGFDFSIEYKRGSENKVADALSRRDEGTKEEQLLALSSPIPHWVDAIREEQQSRSQLKQLVQRVQEDEAVGPWEVRDGLLMFKGRIYVDSDSHLKQDIINQFHGSSHEGFHKTFQREKLGDKISVEPQLPITVGNDETLGVRPMAVLDYRKRNNREEVLVQWQGLPASDATWEDLVAMKLQFPEYGLEDKGLCKRGGI